MAGNDGGGVTATLETCGYHRQALAVDGERLDAAERDLHRVTDVEIGADVTASRSKRDVICDDLELRGDRWGKAYDAFNPIGTGRGDGIVFKGCEGAIGIETSVNAGELPYGGGASGVSGNAIRN